MGQCITVYRKDSHRYLSAIISAIIMPHLYGIRFEDGDASYIITEHHQHYDQYMAQAILKHGPTGQDQGTRGVIIYSSDAMVADSLSAEVEDSLLRVFEENVESIFCFEGKVPVKLYPFLEF